MQSGRGGKIDARKYTLIGGGVEMQQQAAAVIIVVVTAAAERCCRELVRVFHGIERHQPGWCLR
jgi:hypothetical protein